MSVAMDGKDGNGLKHWPIFFYSSFDAMFFQVLMSCLQNSQTKWLPGLLRANFALHLQKVK